MWGQSKSTLDVYSLMLRCVNDHSMAALRESSLIEAMFPKLPSS